MSDRRRIVKVRITNICGIEQIEFEAGSVTVISGANGTGKTSILEAIKAVFDGGHDPTLVRRGAESGEVFMWLDDGSTIRKKITTKEKNGSTLDIRNPDGGKVGKQAEYLARLADGFAYDPSGFWTGTAKDRAAHMLKVMPIEFTGAEVRAAAGLPDSADKAFFEQNGLLNLADHETITLDRLNSIRAGRYTTRTDENRAARDLEGSTITLRSALPKDAKEPRFLDLLRKSVEDQVAAVERRRAEVGTAHREQLQAKKAEMDAALETERVAYMARVEAIKGQFTEFVESANEATDVQLRDIDAAHAESLSEARAELAKAEAAAESYQRAEGVRQQIKANEAKARVIASRVEYLDKAIEGLDALKRQKLDTLPVPGVEVRDGEVFVDGVPWERVNKARQCTVAVALCTLAHGQLPLVVIDEAEVMDADTMAHFKEAAVAAGLQVIMARVESGHQLQVKGE